jgi:HTH-type transcriptional regulator / antitoxin HigA
MKKSRKKIEFHSLPREFAGLCTVLTPRPIRDRADYDNAIEIIEAMVLWEKEFSRDQEDYFEVICTLVERYEAEQVKWPDVSPVEMLRHLVDEHEMSGADLSRVLGGSRHLGSMILRGERSITLSHARKLAAHFGLQPGAFV